ncbi:MAG: DUF2239 family protein [Deltaproteobacteria bacterium]|nr:DUF2239 family protein [Deltaproteobacteria bacterium]
MGEQDMKNCTAFNGNQMIASGSITDVAKKVKELMEKEDLASILIFDDNTAEPVEVDFRGTMADVLERLKRVVSLDGSSAPEEADKPLQRPGRPKLGVVAREVTLLPRHWEWLNSQPGGASVALRKLVEEARKANSGKDRVRQAQEATYRFMTVMGGNLPGYEEATRALYANDPDRFKTLITSWPSDIRTYVERLAGAAFEER